MEDNIKYVRQPDGSYKPIKDYIEPIVELTLTDLKGEKGDKGDKGDPGLDSTIVGPEGKPGKNGKDGKRGMTGPRGLKGELGKDGKDGLKGEKGDRGEDGKTGRDGKPGKDGKDGKTIIYGGGVGSSSGGGTGSGADGATGATGPSIAIKSGYILPTSFTGTPSYCAVTFSTAFLSMSYSVNITGEDSRMWSVSGKWVGGFTASSNSTLVLSGNTYWTAMVYGENN